MKNNFNLKLKNMLPIKHSTYRPSIFSDFDDLTDFFGSFNRIFLNPFDDTSIKCPIHDIIENEKEYVIEAMLAGIKKEDVTVDVNERRLSIEAERKEVKDLKYNRKESFTGKYKRSFILPDDADADNITANLEDGVLTVSVPKLEQPKDTKKKIEIK
jgi:HSP20 family protein